MKTDALVSLIMLYSLLCGTVLNVPSLIQFCGSIREWNSHWCF